MKRVSNLLWPNKFLSPTSKALIFLGIILIYLGAAYYKLYVLQELSALYLAAIYPLIAIWCYLYDRSIPLGAISLEYEEEGISSQVLRLFALLMNAFVLIYCLLFPFDN